MRIHKGKPHRPHGNTTPCHNADPYLSSFHCMIHLSECSVLLTWMWGRKVFEIKQCHLRIKIKTICRLWELPATFICYHVTQTFFINMWFHAVCSDNAPPAFPLSCSVFFLLSFMSQSSLLHNLLHSVWATIRCTNLTGWCWKTTCCPYTNWQTLLDSHFVHLSFFL